MTVTGNGALVPVSDARTATSFPSSSSREVQGSAASGAGAVGLILPPPDLRAIVDKTAQFIAKNGEAFEERILSNQRDNAKFKFLNPKDPYNAYYKAKIAEFQGGANERGPSGDHGSESAAAVVPSSQTLAQVL